MMKKQRFDAFEKGLILAFIISFALALISIGLLVYIHHQYTLSANIGLIALGTFLSFLLVFCLLFAFFFAITLYGLPDYEAAYEESLVKIKRLTPEYSPISLENTTILPSLVGPQDVKAMAKLNEDGKVVVQLCIHSTYETDDYMYLLKYFKLY